MNPSQQNTEEGFAYFSSIKDIYAKADMRYAFFILFLPWCLFPCTSSYLRDLLCFEGDKSMNVANLSRVDPTLLCLKVSGSSPYICYRGSAVPTHCFIMGLVHEDRTRAPYQLMGSGKWMKSLSLIPFALEADRMIASVAIIYETESFHGQVVNGNILSFATRQGMLGEKCMTYTCVLLFSMCFRF